MHRRPASQFEHPTAPDRDPSELVAGLFADGVTACQGRFSREWADRVHEDIVAAFDEAIAGGAGPWPRAEPLLRRDPPEQLRGFVDLASHPWVSAVCEPSSGPTTRS